MNIGDIQQELKSALLSIYDEAEASIIQQWVMDHYTGTARMQRMMDRNMAITPDQILLIRSAKEQLLLHKPMQYVLGEAWFANMQFFVNENVLIPRPETEELVAYLVASCQLTVTSKLSILDIGTGSGCIPIAIKKQLPTVQITAVDVCNEALLVAIKNAARHGTDIHFMHFDFLNETRWNELPVFDCIVSNPPYITAKEKHGMAKHVTAWEPGTALFVPDNDALLFYKKIAAFGKTHLAPNGKIFVETHQDYAIATQQMFETNAYETELKKDINGNNRMLLAWEK